MGELINMQPVEEAREVPDVFTENWEAYSYGDEYYRQDGDYLQPEIPRAQKFVAMTLLLSRQDSAVGVVARQLHYKARELCHENFDYFLSDYTLYVEELVREINWDVPSLSALDEAKCLFSQAWAIV